MDPEVLKALADLAWPVLAAVVVLALLPTIIRVARSRGFSVKYGQMELSVQDVSDQLRKQIEDLQKQVRALQRSPPSRADTMDSLAVEPRHRDAAVHLQVEENPLTGDPEAPDYPVAGDSSLPWSILWVDDHPQNNAHEIAKLQADEWEISTVESTAAALSFLQDRSALPSLIISDVGRREGLLYHRTAGLDLLREVRARGIDVPVFFYTSERAAREHRGKVEKLGGSGITASPIELFGMVERGAVPQRDGAAGELHRH